MSRPTDVVRARNRDTGDHYTTTRHLATKRGDEVLENRPALDRDGRWREPTKHKTITPARDTHGRFTPEADSPEDQPTTGEEEA